MITERRSDVIAYGPDGRRRWVEGFRDDIRDLYPIGDGLVGVVTSSSRGGETGVYRIGRDGLEEIWSERGSVEYLTFSNANGFIALNDDGRCELVAARSGAAITRLSSSERCSSVWLSSAGAVVTGTGRSSSDGTVRVIDMSTGRDRYELIGRDERWRPVDGGFIAVRSSDDRTDLTLYR
jgi:WD40 repeat protein